MCACLPLPRWKRANEEQKAKTGGYCDIKDWAHLQVYTDGASLGSMITWNNWIKRCPEQAVWYSTSMLDCLEQKPERHALLGRRYLFKNNIEFVSLLENFDITPFGRAVIGFWAYSPIREGADWRAYAVRKLQSGLENLSDVAKHLWIWLQQRDWSMTVTSTRPWRSKRYLLHTCRYVHY